MVFLELFDGNKLRKDLGKELVERLTSGDLYPSPCAE
jgi:hypothetical protein